MFLFLLFPIIVKGPFILVIKLPKGGVIIINIFPNKLRLEFFSISINFIRISGIQKEIVVSIPI